MPDTTTNISFCFMNAFIFVVYPFIYILWWETAAKTEAARIKVKHLKAVRENAPRIKQIFYWIYMTATSNNAQNHNIDPLNKLGIVFSIYNHHHHTRRERKRAYVIMIIMVMSCNQKLHSFFSLLSPPKYNQTKPNSCIVSHQNHL